MRHLTLMLGLCFFLNSCKGKKIETPCECVKVQIEMLEGKGPEYGTTFGLCEDLKEGKSSSEIDVLQSEYENCAGYERLKNEYIPFVQELLNDSDIIEKFDNEKMKEALENLGK